jgi:hypothetical protein
MDRSGIGRDCYSGTKYYQGNFQKLLLIRKVMCFGSVSKTNAAVLPACNRPAFSTQFFLKKYSKLCENGGSIFDTIFKPY